MLGENLFEVTKAVDFTDEEIFATWVDLPGGGFSTMASPSSPTTKFLVGGKGGGRTHLLRHYSYQVQRLRHSENVLAGVREDGYVGIYFRCTGLNSARFSGKGLSDDTWSSVFAFYTDLWLAQLTVGTVADLLATDVGSAREGLSDRFVAGVLGLLDSHPESTTVTGIDSLLMYLRELQRSLDIAINNAALKRQLDVNLAARPGRLVFGIPQHAVEVFHELTEVRFAYLLDEFENLTLEQQKYINTLIREKELPSTFLIGSRLWGIRTHETYSAGEENKQGSEFDKVVLEDEYRNHKYKDFCTEIVTRRLESLGSVAAEEVPVAHQFEAPLDGGSLEARSREIVAARGADQRPWLVELGAQLERHGLEPGRARQVVSNLTIDGEPLHEKFGLLMLYRDWAKGRDLVDASSEAGEGARSLASGGAPKKLATSFQHYKGDLYAQILEDLRAPQEYFGFDTFVMMSGYLPRNLIIVLKQVSRWSAFLGERPFEGGKISLRSQREGVREASAWFLADAKGMGQIGTDTDAAIRRLGGFLRALRFSAKPVEVECAAFATDRRGLTLRARECLDEAIAHSLLLEISSGRSDKNTQELNHKYQLNPMLAPLFDLPVARRGVEAFSSETLNAIFDPSTPDAEFTRIRRQRLADLNPPFRASPGDSDTTEQTTLDF